MLHTTGKGIAVDPAYLIDADGCPLNSQRGSSHRGRFRGVGATYVSTFRSIDVERGGKVCPPGGKIWGVKDDRQ